MSTELRNQLQNSLGAAYALERELGGGGMSRVFVAHEAALDRRVVIKVLPHDLVAGVSVDRFKREIQLAAQLQHPNIVPVLFAGETQGLPYFSMPYVEGEAVRARLAREGALPVGEAVNIMRDVARALAYAHDRGVVHRDIKPDNILLSGGSAAVTDFGVAKALSSARGAAPSGSPREMLTAIGTSLGTPAYMAPEQAAADPDTDHRADLYAFGATAYELLTGQTPFAGRTPRALLAAHMSEAAVPVGELRPEVPPALAALVMACLEKDPALRPASAAEVVARIDAAGFATREGEDAVATLLMGKTRRMSLGRALALYAVAFGVVALLARAAVVAAGLPDVVFMAAIAVMLLWLPLIFVTAAANRGSAYRSGARTAIAPLTGTPASGTRSGTASGAHAASTRPILTWRRTLMAGVAAIALFALGITGFVVLRALGIGPTGSLMAAGVIRDQDRILVADFTVGAGVDTVLGAVVTEAFRTDLSQARTVSLVSDVDVRDGLARMRLPASTSLDPELALQLAQRDGMAIVVDGHLAAAGSGFMLIARLVRSEDGSVLSSFRESARNADEILPAIDALSGKLRARLGESLREVRAREPLARVTTSSMEALRKYALGAQLANEDQQRSIALLEEAIAIDTTFAMAYRRLSVLLSNIDQQAERATELMRKAYQHRERLTPVERYLTEGSYYASAAGFDRAKSIAAYESVLELDPRNYIALNNVAIQYQNSGDSERAERYYLRAVAVDSAAPSSRFNLVNAQLSLRKYDEAAATFASAREQFPRNRMVPNLSARVAYAAYGADSAAAAFERILDSREGDSGAKMQALFNLGSLHRQRGRLREADRLLDEGFREAVESGASPSPVAREIAYAVGDIWFRGKPEEGIRRLDAALKKTPPSTLPAMQNPYLPVAMWQAAAGRPDRARATMALYDAAVRDTNVRNMQRSTWNKAMGEIHLAEGDWREAIAYFRRMETASCDECRGADLGRAYDRAEMPDSAIAQFERYLSAPAPGRMALDEIYMPGILKRLGELYEARGDRARAEDAYGRFVDLWKNADPDLVPQVEEVRRRLEMIRAR